MKTIVNFGYNTSDNYLETKPDKIGTKYNFNISGDLIGLYAYQDKILLLTKITESFGDNCMKGTIDVREVTLLDSSTLYSNNEPSEECIEISSMLSDKNTKKQIQDDIPIELTDGFEKLLNLGINLEEIKIDLSNSISVCGIEKESYNYNNIKNTVNKSTKTIK